jgi:4-amino-4-deoxy-L-arabinose transferase-like glycosyltransferase
MRRWLVVAAAVTALGGALRAPVAAHPNARQSVDEHGYASVAIQLAETGRYGRESLHWPPGAPGLFALAARLDGRVAHRPRPDIPGAYWAQWAVGTALVPATFALAALIAGAWAGLAAALVVATYPPLIAVTGDLLSEPLGALLLTAALAALAWAESDSRRRAPPGDHPAPAAGRRSARLVASGVLLGGAVLTRANLLVVVPAVVVALARRDRRGAAILAAAALAPVLAWSLNASLDSGRLVPVSSGGGTSFFIGTFLPGHGTLGGTKVALKAQTQRYAPALRRLRHARELPGRAVIDAVAARHPGIDRDAALRREAWRNVSTYAPRHPAAFAAMLVAKLPRLWLTPSPRSDGLRTPALRVWHLLLVLAALAGALAGRRHPVIAAVLAALVAFTLFHMVVEAIPRYALPAFPALVAAGAAGWALALRRAQAPGPRIEEPRLVATGG